MCGKIKQLLTIAFLGMLLFSCKQSERELNTVEHFDTKTDVIDMSDKIDETIEFIADLPIKIDSSSNFIVFQINELIGDKDKGKLGYSSRDSYRENYLKNLFFQNIQTEEMNILTTNKINILSYEQLYKVNNESEEVILYKIEDTFYNDEKALNLTCLYLSTSDGRNFKKISIKNHQLSSWKYFPELQKVFFKTVENTDNNNKLDNLDAHHMYSVSIQDFKVTELLKEEFKMIRS